MNSYETAKELRELYQNSDVYDHVSDLALRTLRGMYPEATREVLEVEQESDAGEGAFTTLYYEIRCGIESQMYAMLLLNSRALYSDVDECEIAVTLS